MYAPISVMWGGGGKDVKILGILTQKTDCA